MGNQTWPELQLPATFTKSEQVGDVLRQLVADMKERQSHRELAPVLSHWVDNNAGLLVDSVVLLRGSPTDVVVCHSPPALVRQTKWQTSDYTACDYELRCGIARKGHEHLVFSITREGAVLVEGANEVMPWPTFDDCSVLVTAWGQTHSPKWQDAR